MADKEIHFSRPVGRSLAEFKAWMLEVGRALVGDDFKDDLTEEEWRQAWQEFWAKAGAPADQNSE